MSLLNIMNLRQQAENYQENLVNFRRRVHMYPELGFQEFETSKFIQDELKKLGLDPKIYATTGITAEIRGELGEGKTILIRADMDALPMQEDNEAEYKSKIDGVMHACGHDIHVSCLLGVAKLLVDNKSNFRGKVLLVFQPAEEGPGGATPMIKDGAIGELDNPFIDAAISLHVTAGEEMVVNKIAVKDGPLTATADEFYIDILGKGGHGSAPHTAVDPIYVASQIVVQIQGFLTRYVNPMEPNVFTIGKIVGGDRNNIIPAKVSMEATLRTLNRDLRKNLLARIPSFIETISEAHGAIAKVRVVNGYDVGINFKELNDHIREAFKMHYPEEDLIEHDLAQLGAEDFFEFGLEGKIPTAMFWLGGGNEKFTATNHSNYFDVDEGCLPIGTTILAQAAINYLNES
jgi:amidohydrolase